MNYKEELQQNNLDLQGLINMANELPTAGSESNDIAIETCTIWLSDNGYNESFAYGMAFEDGQLINKIFANDYDWEAEMPMYNVVKGSYLIVDGLRSDIIVECDGLEHISTVINKNGIEINKVLHLFQVIDAGYIELASSMDYEGQLPEW